MRRIGCEGLTRFQIASTSSCVCLPRACEQYFLASAYSALASSEQLFAEQFSNCSQQLPTEGFKDTIKAESRGAIMDISGIRMRNYEVQFAAFVARPDQRGLPKHGQLTRFAEVTGTSARYLSHINNGRKNIGDAVARRLELGLGLSSGYMDNLHEKQGEGGSWDCPVGDVERQFVASALRLFRVNPVGVDGALLDYASRQAVPPIAGRQLGRYPS